MSDPDHILQVVRRTLNHALTRNTGWALCLQVTRIVLQTAFFVTITRALGIQGYGTIVAITAPIVFLSPFAGWGSGNILLIKAANNPAALLESWGNSLLAIALSGGVLTLVVGFIGPFLLPGLPLTLFFLLAVAELVLMQICITASQAFQGLERMAWAYLLSSLPYMLKVLASILMITLQERPLPITWATWYIVTMLSSALISIVAFTQVLGRPTCSPSLLLANLKLGAYFSISWSSDIAHAESNKVLLARLSSLEAVGAYSAGHRITSIALVPVQSVLYSTYGRFFRYGALGLSHAVAFSRRLIPICLLWSILAGVSLWVLAPYAQLVLGDQFGEAASVIRWLSPLPFIATVHAFGGNVLSGSGFQGLRSSIQVSVVTINILLNVLLIPSFGWLGAAIATLLSDAILMCGIWLAILQLLSIERRRNDLDILTVAQDLPNT